MNVPKIMVAFHLFFLALAVVTLLLIFGHIIMFDQLALWIIAVAIFLNAFFGALWTKEISTEKQATQKAKATPKTGRHFPLVSFVAPVYNVENHIALCIDNLYECALSYCGPTEILIVDDGSTDNTFEAAWSAINSKRGALANVRVRIVRHSTQLGKIQAIRTAVSKAMGEYVIVTDAEKSCDLSWLTQLVNYIRSPEPAVQSLYIHVSIRSIDTVARSVGLYQAEALRRILDSA